MTATGSTAAWSARKILIVTVILSIILGSVSGLAAGTLGRPSGPSRQTRELFLFPIELAFNDTVAGIPHYVFNPGMIVVNKGDTVKIHFYQPTDESHSFTIVAPYSKDVTLPVATPTNIPKTDITFVADTAGFFVYHCKFHPPTMTGTLQVLG